ncbi:hypothetical protein Mhun_0102 [Methanospirillum hungatei JF-1]|uniref:Flagellin n=1 Tax=Methanospirillum hungatei JF-1 (strain ATCC 27890 / DSM 864 / NBRC 100397 / JF-1) TaxID=323259 RepID=Q2FN26_METHJ|nr:hypothetical protein [Methanospirillum hungatei]ABD39880.1 hypothetical protein Mhun_0102 [Methanospirillum hungatei JF-1]
MASSLIAGAVSLLLIIIAGYVIASGILMVAETTTLAQIDVTAAKEQILQSNIQIMGNYSGSNWLIIDVKNIGNTVFSGTDIQKMDLFIYDGSSFLGKYVKGSGSDRFSYSIENDVVNKNMWDPSEIINININLTNDPAITPAWVKFVTSNGVSSSTNIII